VVVAGENVTITQGGAQAVISGGMLQMEQAGSGFAIARRIRIGRGGIAIFALSGSVEVADGGRVVFGRPFSMAVLGGLVGLVGFTAILRRIRRR
jgi:hypothetical protein